MSTTALKDRNAFSEKVNYNRKTQAKILKAQLRHLVCGKGKPDAVQQLYINSTVILMLRLHNAQQAFEDGGALSKDFESKLRSLQTILSKLGLKSKDSSKPRGKKNENKELDLNSIISSED